MIRHNLTWLCLQRTRLYINDLEKVYGKNALDFHFWKPDHVTSMTSLLSSIGYTVHPHIVNVGRPLHRCPCVGSHSTSFLACKSKMNKYLYTESNNTKNNCLG